MAWWLLLLLVFVAPVVVVLIWASAWAAYDWFTGVDYYDGEQDEEHWYKVRDDDA